MIDVAAIRERYEALLPHLDERGRRILAASEAKTAGYGGIAAVSRATGIAMSTMGRGLEDLAASLGPASLGPASLGPASLGPASLGPASLGPASPLAEPRRVRRPGGGGKRRVTQDATLVADLLSLVEPDARGDPMSPLRWTCKSVSQLTRALVAKSHRVGRTLVRELLRQQKFSLQANRKTREGERHPDRNAQFVHLNESVRAALAAGEPVISVDTKKKGLVGDFKNAGREWRPRGDPPPATPLGFAERSLLQPPPEDVRVHDFLIKELGRAVPYGVYDLAANAGWISVGMSADTSAFAVQTIRRWWRDVGRIRYPEATRLTITADGGGSNGSRVRLWKRELQRLADETGLAMTVHHLPPGTSKWNAIEHRLFAFVSMNWRAKPLVSYRVIVDLISATTTRTGLAVHCELDTKAYAKGIVVSDKEMAAMRITRDPFHGEWNYTIHPNLNQSS